MPISAGNQIKSDVILATWAKPTRGPEPLTPSLTIYTRGLRPFRDLARGVLPELPSVETSLLSRDDELLARLQAPPDLCDGLDSLAYWHGRRVRLPWYRRRAKREAARMVFVWERRVRAAMLRQRGAPLASRFLAARLLASGPLRRSARRAGFAVAATMLLVLAMAPALLVVSVLLKLF